MKYFYTALVLMLSLSSYAQWSAGKQVAKDEATGLYYVTTLGGQIWEDDGTGVFNYVPNQVAGGNSGWMVIVNGKLYIVRINKLKVYNLQPQVELDTIWDIPATNWLIGLAWDGNNTLYCHDQEEIFQVNMSTGAATSIFNDMYGSEKGMEHDPFANRLIIVKDGSPNSVIYGYDIQTSSYDTLLFPPIRGMYDLDLACNNQWLITANLGSALLYSVPLDFSNPGDTVALLSPWPYGIYYDDVSNRVVYVKESTIDHVDQPCIATGITETSFAQTELSVIQTGSGVFVMTSDMLNNETLRLLIVDMRGKVVWDEQVNSNQLQHGHKVYFDSMSQGLYNVIVLSATNRLSNSIFVD